MIDKVIIRGVMLVAMLFGSWFALKQVNWVHLLGVDALSRSEYMQQLESELGDIMLNDFLQKYDIVDDSLAVAVVDSLAAKLCDANGIDKNKLSIYIFSSDEVNAFALPNHQLVIYTGLIQETSSPEALCGVMAHELAHIEGGHVIQSLKREVGLGVLFGVVTGRQDFKVIKQLGKLLSSTAFNRRMEREADLTGLDYLQKAQIDPEPFAEFMGALGEAPPEVLQWISTHPFPDDRKEYLLQRIKNQPNYPPVLPETLWQEFKDIFE